LDESLKLLQIIKRDKRRLSGGGTERHRDKTRKTVGQVASIQRDGAGAEEERGKYEPGHCRV
jgi:hypothetical protein